MSNEERLKQETFIKGLTLYKMNLNQKITEKREEIEQCKNRIRYTENVLLKRDYWDLLFNKIKMENIELPIKRQLVLELVNSVVVDEKDQITIVFKEMEDKNPEKIEKVEKSNITQLQLWVEDPKLKIHEVNTTSNKVDKETKDNNKKAECKNEKGQNRDKEPQHKSQNVKIKSKRYRPKKVDPNQMSI